MVTDDNWQQDLSQNSRIGEHKDDRVRVASEGAVGGCGERCAERRWSLEPARPRGREDGQQNDKERRGGSA